MRRDALDVIVVGAGVVGSAAALALANEGLRVAIVEVREPPGWRADSQDLRVYALAADSRNLLESLGVWPGVLAARAQAYRRMRVWDAAAAGELCFDADRIGRENLGHIVEHVLLVDRLWNAVGAHPSIQRRCPSTLAGIEQGEGSVSALLEGGERLRARLLVGADGAASPVRELCRLSFEEKEYRQRGLVAYVETEQPHEETCWQRFLPGGPLAFLPCADGRSSIVWTLPDADASRWLAADDHAFTEGLTRAFDARLGAVLATSARQAFPLRRKLSTTMLQGNVVLVGDAAHVVHPLAGQGMNLGLRDVEALAGVARGARASGRDWLAPHRLERWARSRASENAMSAYTFEAINGFFSNDALVPTLLRGPLLGLAGSIPPLSQWLWKRAAGL